MAGERHGHGMLCVNRPLLAWIFENSFVFLSLFEVESSWNVMAHADAWEGKWRGNWRMECVVSTLHTTSEHGVSSITTADAHTSTASSRLNWRPCRFKWTRPFRRKTKSGFCACAITFQTQSTASMPSRWSQILRLIALLELGLAKLSTLTDTRSYLSKHESKHAYCRRSLTWLFSNSILTIE
jgi:hypothetical protein